jgi:hypothetical protein
MKQQYNNIIEDDDKKGRATVLVVKKGWLG